MDYKINDMERDALRGLPYMQRVLYCTAIRPFMDYTTGIVGLKRGISYQSLAEELYIEPHAGYASGCPNRNQLRRAIANLERAGLLESKKHVKKLIFKCVLASVDYCTQKQVGPKQAHQAGLKPHANIAELSEHYRHGTREAGPPTTAQAGPPPVNKYNNKNNNHHRAREGFSELSKKINPDFSPSPRILEQAQKLDCADQHCSESVVRFILHHQSKGTTSFHWDAEYLRWLLNGKKYADKQEKHHERNSNHWSSRPTHKRGRSAIERVMDAHSEFFKRSGRIIATVDRS